MLMPTGVAPFPQLLTWHEAQYSQSRTSTRRPASPGSARNRRARLSIRASPCPARTAGPRADHAADHGAGLTCVGWRELGAASGTKIATLLRRKCFGRCSAAIEFRSYFVVARIVETKTTPQLAKPGISG